MPHKDLLIKIAKYLFLSKFIQFCKLLLQQVSIRFEILKVKMTQQFEPHVLKKYEIIQKLGKGAYGIVWKAIDRKQKKVVALKKVFDAFHNATDAQRTFRQVMFLQQLNGHENIVQLLNVQKSDNNKDLYLIFDYMQTDLHLVIRAGIVQQIHRKFIIYQLLKGLKYMHSAELIHRDLKPSNILIDANSKIKIADFGLSRSVYKTKDSAEMYLTQYVATRWYRAPQILLGSTQYSKAVDMWSVGCILGQLIIGKSMFPGNSTLNQIQRILQITGKPSQKDIDSIESPLATNIISGITIPKKKELHLMFPTAHADAIDLMKKLFLFNPHQRYTAQQSLQHPYLKTFHQNHQKQQLVHQSPVIICLDDNKKFSIRQYRQVLYQGVSMKKKQQKKKWQQKILNKLGFNDNSLSSNINMIPQKQHNFQNKTNHLNNQIQSLIIDQQKQKSVMSFADYKHKYMNKKQIN